MSHSIPMHPLGGKAFNHNAHQDAEKEYERLRGLAHQEAEKRNSCFDRAHQAYERGDGAEAKELSNEGKRHAAKMEEHNKQASDYIFRENNATGRVADDTIDLHGQFTEEAEDILETRLRYARQQGQTHLHVIVGKGNHSAGHVQKLKPRVERVCTELGLKFATEENAGRIYINLQGGEAVPPPQHHDHGRDIGGGAPKPEPQPQPQPPQEGGGGGGGGGQEQKKDDLVTKLSKKLGECCIVM